MATNREAPENDVGYPARPTVCPLHFGKDIWGLALIDRLRMNFVRKFTSKTGP